MQFNNFLWNNYKESKNGELLIEFFTNYKQNLTNRQNHGIYKNIIQRIKYDKDELDNLDNYFNAILEFSSDLSEDLKENDTNVSSFSDVEEIYTNLFSLVAPSEIDKENPEPILGISGIPFLSECLFILYPEYFFPYYFTRLYHDVMAIFNEFGIFLPPVPKKNDKEKRIFHYLELCKSLYDFRLKQGISKYELPAFLYGFAPEVIKKFKISDQLPEPRKAYFVGGGKKDKTVDSSGDFDYLDKADSTTVTSWNGNPETQPGDIIVMYCLTPRSYIHSIWRAITPGSHDPFFHYYQTVYIGQPIKIKPISIEEIKNDNILSEMPLVKGNMQGINGRVISKKYYDQILKLLTDKGEDISSLPQLNNDNIHEVELKDEKDIEEKLLEPLLQKIGYKHKDWKRQLKLRMGRGDRVFPDYVIFPNEERNNESGYWVWEAKYTIDTNKQFQEDFGQAKSYALRLKCTGLGLVSKEGIWLSKSDFDIEKVKFWSWQQVNDKDCIDEIFDIAGCKQKHN